MQATNWDQLKASKAVHYIAELKHFINCRCGPGWKQMFRFSV